MKRYQSFLDHLPAFTVDRLNPDQIDEALKEIRRLWLFAPDDVVRAANAFIQAAKEGQTKRSALGKLVLAMRKDVSFEAALVPRFYRSDLKENEVSEIVAAKRLPPESPL